ncbi:YcjX family protein [Falsigemmobacter intermedius]|uniref:YcjX family protein n=1 Tax=Falsigemmobacter intermedius TaxID=1553448 RepID=A0A444MBG5_9RHOB|nr:YcjX family protein [Falsigemmobacter intermedius]RWY41074.1 YcjX family protein [Falsigemmobacter intermedius]
MGVTELAQDLAHEVSSRVSGLSESLFDPVIRLGVTGLARAGKTVFITSLVSNLLDRGRMSQLQAEAQGRIEAVWLQPQPDDTVPRFDFEGHLGALTGPAPRWPDSTRAVSELRLSFRMRPSGLLKFTGPRKVHLDIIDYPGEWLLDLGLMDLSYQAWSDGVLSRVTGREEAQAWFRLLSAVEDATWDEPLAKDLAGAWRDLLAALRLAGMSDVTPGRFLMPGEMEGSPALTFAPLPRPETPASRGLWREMERRFEAYKSRVVRPFFRDHFSRIDRQVVLVDALQAIHSGPAALEDMRRAMAAILGAFRPGRGGILSELLLGRRVERILFAATRADHLHHSQHARLVTILSALLREAKDRADFAGAETAAMAIAAVRATTEVELQRGSDSIQAVQGRLADTGRVAAMYAGDLPSDPSRLLVPAREGASGWLDGDYAVMRFAPAIQDLVPGQGLPHIRLDRAAEFLIGDLL